MEQTRYWMWTRRKLGGRPLLNSEDPVIAIGASYDDSWEEQAFAEDSAGHLGGCVWPPRSYSCSFCRREFRSAQALGGHMNVHRRDRARLKQSPSENDDTHHLHHLNPCVALNPNPSPGVVASPLSPSALSSVTTRESCREHSLVSPSYSSSIIQDHLKVSLLSTPRSLIDPVPLQPSSNLELRLGMEKRGREEVGCRGPRDVEDAINCKRRRTDPMLPSFVKGAPHEELLKLSHGPVEELDLELRLGDPPKVK